MTNRSYAYCVIVRINSRRPRKKDVRKWIPVELWPHLHYCGKEDSGIDSQDEGPKFWDHVWSGTLNQGQMDTLREAMGGDYVGEQGGILGPHAFPHVLVPDLRWELNFGGDEGSLAICPFPADLTTPVQRWEDIARDVEAHYRLEAQSNVFVRGFEEARVS